MPRALVENNDAYHRLLLVAINRGGVEVWAQSQADRLKEATDIGHPGRTFSLAIAYIEKAGFECEENYPETDETVCSRQQSYQIFATCIQSVVLSLARDKIHLGELRANKPACASL